MQVDQITLNFGGVRAISGVSVDAFKGEIHAIIGPNGAGKTSMLNCISGLYHPQAGHIRFFVQAGRQHEITHLRPAQIARLGIPHMTVLDNLMLGRHVHMKSGVLSGGLYWGFAQKEEIRHRQVIEDIIDFLEIEHIRKKTVGTLSYGLQKRVELGRALAVEPTILLHDEPMAGMKMEEKEDMARFILDINEERGITTILIEHDMGVVMDISDRVAVLEFGMKLAEGTPDTVKANPEVIRAYLGQDHNMRPHL